MNKTKAVVVIKAFKVGMRHGGGVEDVWVVGDRWQGERVKAAVARAQWRREEFKEEMERRLSNLAAGYEVWLFKRIEGFMGDAETRRLVEVVTDYGKQERGGYEPRCVCRTYDDEYLRWYEEAFGHRHPHKCTGECGGGMHVERYGGQV